MAASVNGNSPKVLAPIPSFKMCHGLSSGLSRAACLSRLVTKMEPGRQAQDRKELTQRCNSWCEVATWVCAVQQMAETMKKASFQNNQFYLSCAPFANHTNPFGSGCAYEEKDLMREIAPDVGTLPATNRPIPVEQLVKEIKRWLKDNPLAVTGNRNVTDVELVWKKRILVSLRDLLEISARRLGEKGVVGNTGVLSSLTTPSREKGQAENLLKPLQEKVKGVHAILTAHVRIVDSIFQKRNLNAQPLSVQNRELCKQAEKLLSLAATNTAKPYFEKMKKHAQPKPERVHVKWAPQAPISGDLVSNGGPKQSDTTSFSGGDIAYLLALGAMYCVKCTAKISYHLVRNLGAGVVYGVKQAFGEGETEANDSGPRWVVDVRDDRLSDYRSSPSDSGSDS